MLFQPDPPAGGAGGSSQSSGSASQGGAAGGTSTAAPTPEERREGRDEILTGLLHSYGTYERAAQVLASENWDYRRKNKDLNAQVVTLQSRVPADGAIVLTGDDAKAWPQIKALNLTGEKLVERVKRADELEQTVVAEQRQKVREEAAKAQGWNATVLSPLLDQHKLDVDMRDVLVKDASGKESTQKVPYVRKSDDKNAAWEKLSDVVDRDPVLKAFIPALKVVPQGGSTNGASGSTSAGSTSVVMPEQSGTQNGSQSQGGGSLLDRHLQRVKERANRPNPLNPPKPQGGPASTAQGAK